MDTTGVKALGRCLRDLYDVMARKPLSWAIIDRLESIREREEAPTPLTSAERRRGACNHYRGL